MSDEFESLMNEMAEQAEQIEEFEPMACYNSDGDCVEFHLSNENYRGLRVDRWLTVFIGENSGSLVGGMVKSIKNELVNRAPGMSIDAEHSQADIPLSTMIRVAAYESEPIGQTRGFYRELLDLTSDSQINTNFQMA